MEFSLPVEERQVFTYTLQICLKNTENLEKLLNSVANQGQWTFGKPALLMHKERK